MASQSSSTHIILSNTRFEDTIFDYAPLGVHYQITSQKQGGIFSRQRHFTVTKWSDTQPQRTTVAEWMPDSRKSQVIKIPAVSGDAFKSLESIFPSHRRSVTFYGPDKRLYKWKTIGKYRLYCQSGEQKQVLASYHRPILIIGRRKASIELFQGCETILDLLVVGFVLAFQVREKRKRRVEAANNAGEIAGAVASIAT